MLLQKSYTGTKPSVYKCDRCGVHINNEPGVRFHLTIDTKSKTSYGRQKIVKSLDLCKSCARIVVSVAAKQGGDFT